MGRDFLKRFSLFCFIGLTLVVSADVICKYILKIQHKQSFLNVDKMDHLFNKINNRSILFIGDSRLEWGIKPLVIDSVLKEQFPDHNCLNLAMINNNGLSAMEYLIKQNKAPAVLVYNYNIINYQYKDFEFNNYSTEFLRHCTSLKNRAQEFFLQNTYVLEPQFESIKNHMAKNNSIYEKVRYDNNGGCYVWQMNSYENKKKAQMTGYKNLVDSFKYQLFVNYANRLNSCLNSFRKKGTTVVLLEMPICEDLKVIESLDTTKVVITSLCKDHTIDYTNYDKDLHLPEDKFYFDGSHINRSESVKFSASVAGELKPILKKITK